MKLYVYDHCPYCVKARMIFGLKDLSFELKVLLNDDEETPKSMIGVKMVPILERPDGSFLPESLDIIRYVDNLKNKPMVSFWEPDTELSQWLQNTGFLSYQLAMPRWVNSCMEEFKSPSSRAYFTRKKEKMIGPFNEALSRSDSLKKDMEACLNELEDLLPSGGFHFYSGDKLTVNDFHLFAFLRALSIVKGLCFPAKTASYMNRMSNLSKVPLNYDIAS